MINLDSIIGCPKCNYYFNINDERTNCKCRNFQFVYDNGIIIAIPANSDGKFDEYNELYAYSGVGACHFDENIDFEKISGEIWRLLIVENHLKRIHHMYYDIYPYINTPNKIIETGAGMGIMALWTKMNYPNSQIIITDISLSAIRLAQRLFDLFNLDATFLVSDAQNLPIMNNSIEFAYSSATVHHMPAPKKYLKEIYRILEQNSTYIANEESVVNKILRPILLKTYYRQEQKKAKETGTEEPKISYGEWKKWCKYAGFEEIRIIAETHSFFAPSKVSSLIRNVNKILPFLMKRITTPIYVILKKTGKN